MSGEEREDSWIREVREDQDDAPPIPKEPQPIQGAGAAGVTGRVGPGPERAAAGGRTDGGTSGGEGGTSGGRRGNQSPHDPYDETDPDMTRRAVIHKRTERGPNLNSKALRRSLHRREDEEAEADWSLPPAYTSPTPTPPPPTPSPPPPPPTPTPEPPTPPYSVGGTPPQTPADVFKVTEEEKQKKAQEYDEEIKKINESKWAQKPLTKWVGSVVVKETQRAIYKDNTEQVSKGLELVETVTEPALNRFFSLLTTGLPYVVFSVSVIAALVDIIISRAANARYTITCFSLDMVEVAFLTANFLVHKTSWYQNKSEDEKNAIDKRQQIVDNVLAEVLLYPTILCSVFGIAVETPFLPENFLVNSYSGHMGRLDLFLIVFDVSSLIYVYGSRMYIIGSFMQRLNTMFPEALDGGFFSVTSRFVYTIIMNSVLFMAMLTLLALQIYHENQPEQRPADLADNLYYVSHVTAYMVIATLIVPIFSIVIFVFANYYYILELMIRLNIHVLKNAQMREKLEDYGEMAQGMLGFAKQNVHATPGRLRDIQSLSTFKRVFYVLREWWIDLLFFLWTVILVLYAYFYYEYASREQVTGTFWLVYLLTFVICVAMFILANYHTFAIVLITNILLLPLLLSFSFQTVMDKCRNLRNRQVDPEEAEAEERKLSANDAVSSAGETDRPATQITVAKDSDGSVASLTGEGSKAEIKKPLINPFLR